MLPTTADRARMAVKVAATSTAIRGDAWHRSARPAQLPPSGEWRTWVVMAGRGFGKTRTGSEWIADQIANHGKRRIALVAATAADAREVMVEGESGIMAVCDRRGMRPLYEPSKRRLTWPNGAIATTYSADEPNRLRGPQHDASWCDEIGAWRRGVETWDNLQFGLRLGDDPRSIVTTTPRPVPIVKALLKAPRPGDANPDELGTVVISGGSSDDNLANLAPAYRAIIAKYRGTRLGRQEIGGELLEDVPGALWTLALIESTRLDAIPEGVELVRVAVGVDPAISSGEDSNETGIVAAARGSDGRAYVLEDVSGRYKPTEWAHQAINLYHRRQADRIVAETNQGGEMVETTIRVVDDTVAYTGVHASRGKQTRAEPISALYEQGKASHIGAFPALEDQLVGWVPGMPSPDRLDSLVWVLTDLMLDGGGPIEPASGAVSDFYRRVFG